LWVHSATRGGSIVGCNAAEIEHICRIELLETLKHPYTDGCMYNVDKVDLIDFWYYTFYKFLF